MNYKEYKELIKGYKDFKSFRFENDEFFNLSWYKHKSLTEKEINYLDLLSKTFRVESPQRDLVRYIPYSWQIDYHCGSLLVNAEKTKNDFIMKARGISYSCSTFIEGIMVGLFYGGTKIPLIVHRLQAGIDLIKLYGKPLCKNAYVDIEVDPNIETELRFRGANGRWSTITPLPSGTPQAAEAIRSQRPIMVIIDEGGIQPYLENVYVAADDSLQTAETKIGIGGTPIGTMNYFWKLHKEHLGGFNKYFLRMFNYDNVRYEVIDRLKPLVWWANKDKLKNKIGEKNQKLDKFLQEYQCSPFDGKNSLVPENYIDEAIANNYELDKKICYCVVSIDVATIKDLAVITAFLISPGGQAFKQIYLKYYKQIELPDLEIKINKVIKELKPDDIRPDNVGMGVHLTQNLIRKYGKQRVHPVDTRTKFKLKNMSLGIPMKEHMCENFASIVKCGRVDLINDEIQKDHILNVTKKYDYKSLKGHNDIFVADCMACLPPRFNSNDKYEFNLCKIRPKEITKDVEDIKINKITNDEFLKRYKINSNFNKMKGGFAKL